MAEETKMSFPILVSNRLVQDIVKLKHDFSASNRSTYKTKETQKEEANRFICKLLNIDILLSNAVFTNNSGIYISYPFFKLFANPDIYEKTIDIIFEKILELIINYGSFTVHINIDSFTVTSAYRYKELINQLFIRLYQLNYEEHLTNMYLYNTPQIIEFMQDLFRNICNKEGFSNKVIMVK